MKNRYAWDKPRFESRFEQRRFVFLSNLFTLLGRLDAQGSARGRDGRELAVHVGDQYVKFQVETLASLRPRTRSAITKKEPMAIEIEVARWQHGEREERLFWSDGEDGKLEDRVREIGVAIVLTGERQYRKAREFFTEWTGAASMSESKRPVRLATKLSGASVKRVSRPNAIASHDCSAWSALGSRRSRSARMWTRSCLHRRRWPDVRSTASATPGPAGHSVLQTS